MKKSKKSPKMKSKKSSTIRQTFTSGIEKITERVQNIFSGRPGDITAALKMDHDDLRNFMKTLKDTNENMTKRRRAYKMLADLLRSHTIAEEQIVYKNTFKLTGKELHIKVAEGFVEHQLQKDLMFRMEHSKKSLDWSAQANVLAEILEHHLKEEERDLFPLIRKKLTARKDADLLTKYIDLRAKTQNIVTEKNAGTLGLF